MKFVIFLLALGPLLIDWLFIWHLESYWLADLKLTLGSLIVEDFSHWMNWVKHAGNNFKKIFSDETYWTWATNQATPRFPPFLSEFITPGMETHHQHKLVSKKTILLLKQRLQLLARFLTPTKSWTSCLVLTEVLPPPSRGILTTYGFEPPLRAVSGAAWLMICFQVMMMLFQSIIWLGYITLAPKPSCHLFSFSDYFLSNDGAAIILEVSKH